MADLRAFLGSKCPSCRNDILQPEPSTNRMPGPARAWCPSCHASLSAEELAAGPRRGGLLKRLFSKPSRT
ncbi:MAG: hypothetical protein QOE90_2449 [Thermoplasmata archaeon]|jgi:hypothetical protein|nr:hypothetical protein [Thermoplasmata archaeon]